MRRCCRFFQLAGLTLLVSGAALAQNGYNIQVVARGGDAIGGVTLADGTGSMGVVGMNDSGELLFFTQDTERDRMDRTKIE